MKKKCIAIILTMLATISLISCGNSNSNASRDTQETVTQDANPNEKTVDGVRFTLESAAKEPVKGDRTQDNVARDNGEYFANGSKIVKAEDYEYIIVNLKIENSTDKAITLAEYGWTAKMNDGYKLNNTLNSKELDNQVASHNNVEGKIKLLVEKKLNVKEFELKYNLIDYTNFGKMLSEAMSGAKEEDLKKKYPELAKENYATFNIKVE